ncbi:P-loop containing nucleoside triphosphate hydrolase protein [Triangularia verruculosa]|uniref:P-loop containing nucleoside triphosphate hydrolase protein n=1 Tax=Triangularia verruculosa TaxID=2587418 RepID=A0AAN6XU30_9PEZI|nr:P-loop containing nucleoside triphosphate hydrolase protein [Triangularia verruculosa]
MASNANSQRSPLDDQTVLVSHDRLFKIDQLRALNIGKYVPLPQLVAVGDQSSGKSSLLETLTQIPFPRGQELCTRYATQITHRRDNMSFIGISIIPGPQASAEHRENLESFFRQVGNTAQLQAEFPAILDEVNSRMGIRTASNPAGKHTFSEDVLKIEKCGPDEDYLTVIDVPGIFRTTTEGITTESDKKMVRDMVINYIKDPRTIILAVLPANVDVATQEILALAEHYDKAGERTLGVLTKSDLLTERSAKASVCALVLGHRKPLKLGYYIVRNRGGDDDDADSDLAKREDMFRQQPWCDLPAERVGVTALRQCLQGLLGEITDQAFPLIQTQLRDMLAETQRSLDFLGASRKTSQEQRQYLATIAGRFQELVRAALDGDYSKSRAFEDGNLRLITMIVQLTEWFDRTFRKSSHTYLFVKQKGLDEDDADPEEPQKISDINTSLYPELKRLLCNDWTISPPVHGIMTWIGSIHNDFRGISLGTVSPVMLASAFRGQSVKWELIAKQYVSLVIMAVHQFIMKGLENVCNCPIVRQRLAAALLSRLLTTYEGALKQAMLLVEIETQRKPYTLNHYFNSNMQKVRGLKMKDQLAPHAEAIQRTPNEAPLYVRLENVSSVVENKGNAEYAREEIHDTLRAYYKVASKRFVDYVYYQAVDHCLLTGPENPLLLFSEKWVLGLDDGKLASISGENQQTTIRRAKLEKKVQDLKEAIEIL